MLVNRFLRAAVLCGVSTLATSVHATYFWADGVLARVVNVESATRFEVALVEKGGRSHTRNHLLVTVKGVHATPNADQFAAIRAMHDRRITLKNCQSQPPAQTLACDFLIDLGRLGVAPIDGRKYLVALQLAQAE